MPKATGRTSRNPRPPRAPERRRICVVTGSRADFGLLTPVMNRIRQTPGLSLQVVVAGMHLDFLHGMTIREVEKYFSVDARVPMANRDGSGRGMAEALGSGLRAMARALDDLQPHVVVVLGDRDEALCGALAASHMAIPIGHIHGGDVSHAGVDDANRHAITKLAHLHFAATPGAARRIVRMGENPRHVHVVGSPSIDNIATTRFYTRLEVFRRLGIPTHEDVLVVIQHPISYRPEASGAEMRELLAAVASTGVPAVLLYPNSDPGARGIIDVIRSAARPPQYRIFKSLERDFFLSLLSFAKVMVGNSSSGIIDAPYFGLPCVQVGERQSGRERAANVIDVPPERKKILTAIRKACFDVRFRRTAARSKSPYGNGTASAAIARILREADLGPELVQKQLHYA